MFFLNQLARRRERAELLARAQVHRSKDAG
jgi:hypothetical protein